MFKDKGVVYFSVLVVIHTTVVSTLNRYMLTSWLDQFGEYRLLLQVSLNIVLVCFSSVAGMMILIESGIDSRRFNMKKPIIKWLLFVVYMAAFVVLMAGVYAKANSPLEAMIVIIACSVMYVINVLALMRLFSDKKE